MAISDRTRKLLWGHSGNRCAICRRLLAVDPTGVDPAAVVGDECHIVAQSSGGPRAGELESGEIDAEDNLILLCRTDHKRVDDQPNHFTPERLRSIKGAHESWVESTLSAPVPPSLAIRRGPNEEKFRLALARTGSEILAATAGSCASDYDHVDLRDQNEVELVSDFLQQVHDCAEFWEDAEPGQHVRMRFELTQAIEGLAAAGFLVYAGRLMRILDGAGTQSPWPVGMVSVVRTDDFARIVVEEVARQHQQKAEKSPPAASS